jgi:CBS domain-containing protein
MFMWPTVENLISGKIYSIESEQNVHEAAKEMARREIGSLLITREVAYIGIVTEVDLIRKVVAKRIDPGTISVKKVMTAPLITIEADRSVVEANDLMEEKKTRHLVVTRNGVIVGLVSVRDFLRPLSVEQPSGF